MAIYCPIKAEQRSERYRVEALKSEAIIKNVLDEAIANAEKALGRRLTSSELALAIDMFKAGRDSQNTINVL